MLLAPHAGVSSPTLLLCERLKNRGGGVDPFIRVRIERGGTVAAADYIEMGQTRRRLVQAMDARLAGLDALVLPTTPIVAPKLSEVAASLNRWYGIDLQVPDGSLATRHLTATFSGESPERVLDVIRLVLGADIERHGDTAIVRAKR